MCHHQSATPDVRSDFPGESGGPERSQEGPSFPPRGPLPAQKTVGEARVPEPVVGSAAAAGGSVAAIQVLMVATNSLGWTSFSASDQLTIVAATGIVSPVIAALIARLKVFALR